MDNRRILVLYTFHEYNYNVDFFIKNGIFYDQNVDFIIIINNEYIKIDVPDYVKILNRKNIGYDFGGWSDGLLTNNLYKNYDYFIFANSSVIGPIIPKYYKNRWINIFLDGLVDDIKLYGCTINTCDKYTCDDPVNSAHVQSYVFCIDKNTLEYLISKEIFSQTNLISEYIEVVQQKEVKMSREIINNNWNIGCLFYHYNSIDFRNLSNINKNIFLHDITSMKYYDQIVHPYEVIFVKDKYISNKNWLYNYIDKIEYIPEQYNNIIYVGKDIIVEDNVNTSNHIYWKILLIIIISIITYIIINKTTKSKN